MENEEILDSVIEENDNSIHGIGIKDFELEEFKEAIIKADHEALDNVYDSFQPADIATELEEFDDDELAQSVSLFSDEQLAEIIENSDEDMHIRIVKYLDNGSVLKIFKFMAKDDVADFLGNIPTDRRKQIVDLMTGGDKRTIHELLGYSEDSAGGLMTTAYIALSETLSTIDALKKIKQIGPKTEVIETIFVLNHAKQLIGTADLRDILVAGEEDLLRDMIEGDAEPICVEPDVDQEEVSRLFAEYDLKVLPVVNKRRAMLGIITVDDIIDVINEEHTEDLYQMAGVGKEESLDNSIPESIKMRLPWLLVNLLTAFLAAVTIKAFEGVIQQVVALSATMTIVSGMGGNAGTQTLSIMIRSIALGEVEFKDCWKILLREVMIGLANGFATGLATGLIVWLMYGNIYLGVIILMAMIGNLIIAGVFGILIPVILKVLKLDPALGSTVFVTTATDVLGFFIFLGLASMFLPLLA
ncbi:MAG: magnesium transporter [Lachnospiraceae bacterium]